MTTASFDYQRCDVILLSILKTEYLSVSQIKTISPGNKSKQPQKKHDLTVVRNIEQLSLCKTTDFSFI